MHTSEIVAGPHGVVDARAAVHKGDGVGMSWFHDHLAAGGDEAVRTETLLRQGTVWAGVNLIAGDMGQIPFSVKRTIEGGEEDAPNHPIARLLRDGPNSWQTIDQWLEWMQSTAIVWGNAVSRIVKDRQGNVTELVPIPPIFLDWNVLDGEPYYTVSAPDGQGEILRPDQVIHLRTISTTGFWGLRLAEVAYSELTLDKSAKRHAANVFANGAFPSGVLEHPGKLGPEARSMLRKEWEAIHGGGKNAGRTAVLWEGMSYNAQAVTPADAQLIEILSHDAVLVGKVLGVSPYFLGDLRHNATRANLEEESKQYYARTLRRRVLSLEKELQRKLIRVPVYRVRADPTEFLKGDFQTQVEVAAALVQAKLGTQNEGRRYIGFNPVPDGDVFFNPAIDTTESQEPAGDDDATVAAARRIRRNEVSKLAKAVETSRDFDGYVAKFYDGPFMEIVRSEVPNAPDLEVYQARQRATVLDYAGRYTKADMSKKLTDEPIEPDALAIAAYIKETN